MYTIGSAIGGVCSGIVSDKLVKRSIIIAPMILISGVLMFCVY